MGRVARKPPKRLRPHLPRRRLAARRLLKFNKALQQHLMNNSLDTSGTCQQRLPSKHVRKRQRERTPSSGGYSRRKRHYSSSSPSLSSETSSHSSSSSSAPHSHQRKHKHQKHKHRKHKCRHYRTRRYFLPRSLLDRIRQGKYVMFDKLLLPQNVPSTPKPSKGKAKQSKSHVVDLPSWLEAWNRYICVRVAYDCSMALELVKYQTIMVMLFANNPPAHCLNYDSLFRQAASRDPTLRWDTIKEDIYVSAIEHYHNTSASQFQSTFFDRLPMSARLGPPPAESDKSATPHATHTAEGKKSASGTMWDAARGGKNASPDTSAGTEAARVSTLANSVPNVLEL